MRAVVLLGEQLELILAANVPKLSHGLTAQTLDLMQPRLFLLIHDKVNHHLAHLYEDTLLQVLSQRLGHSNAILKGFAGQQCGRV